MSAHYEGQSPSRLWYAWQYTKGAVQAVTQKNADKDVRKTITYGVAAVGLAFAAVGSIFIPFVPGVLPLICAGAAAASGRNAKLKFTMMKRHPAIYNYVRKQEERWVQKKSRPALTARVAAFGKRLLGHAALPFAVTGKWSGYGAALLGAVGAGLTLTQSTGMTQIPYWANLTAGVAKAGAVLGLSASAAMTGAVVLAIAAIPVGLGIGKLCRNMAQTLKNDFIAHEAASGVRPTLKSRLERPTVQKRVMNDNTPAAAEAFQQSVAAQKKEEALSAERKKAAAARAEARVRNKRNPQQRF